MAKHLSPLLLLLLPLSFLLVVYLRPASATPGGWSPIKNLTDPHLKELGGFAVAEHDKVANDGLEFVKVVKGDQQVVSGMKYRLVLEVKNLKEEVVKYQAEVWERPGSGSKQLTSFKRV
ncbi:Cysteine proteinase inhibitor [Rhynchospora pubera]|uniref:Cysteine proteinase inhibitor n=1 Tax=Rhynchospora pubera TaxID=906938 RepID=A0AAV8D2Y0_9POAL|nr:Cysteine proteinase inhibitor [Rhynchospora pubera]